MLKIITKGAHNALLYQIEDLKKKLADGLEINDEIFNDLIAKNDTIRKQNHKINELENDVKYISDKHSKLEEANEFLNNELRTSKKKYDLCASRHKSCVLRNEKLQKANTSLLSKNESLTAENHRLGNLLQVKCDEVKTLEKKIS